MVKRASRINGKLVGQFTEAQLQEIEAYEAGPFTSKPKIQPHEQSAVATDRETAATLGFNERDTEAFIKNRLMLRRQAEHIRRQEQLRIGESISIILNPALKREYDRQQAQTAGQGEPREYGPNEERDRWLYGQRENDRNTWHAVLSEFKVRRLAKGWQAVELNGIRAAVARYAEFYKLPLRKGRAGRPRANK